MNRRSRVIATMSIAVLIATAVIGLSLQRARAQAENPPGRILFVRDGVAWVWENGSATELFGDGNVSDPRWSPDGNDVLYVSNQAGYSDLVLWSSVTGTIEALTDNAPPVDLQPGSQEYVTWSSWARDPSWSASGRIGFAADYEPSGRMALWLMESPEAGAVAALEYEPSSRDIEGVSLSTSGELAAYTERTFDGAAYSTTVVLRDLSDGIVYPLLDEVDVAFDPAISPDEQWIAMTIRSASGVSDIWIVARSGLTSSQITLSAQANGAVWSPDGNWLAYVRPDGDEFEILAIPIQNGSAAGEPISLGSWNDVDAASGLSWGVSG